MVNSLEVSVFDLIKELFRVRLYKNNQGRLVRRLTMIGVIAVFLSGAYKFYLMPFAEVPFLQEAGVRGLVSLLLCAFGGWFGFRLVNWPPFADFLVSVEAEMVKVSWPGKAELYSSTIVVLVMFFLLAIMIHLFDLIWVFVFNYVIGVMA